jgi:hypothetical protein
MGDPPFHAIPVIVDDEVRLRIYRGSDLELEIPLRQRQTIILAAQLLNHGLMADGRVGGDAVGRCRHDLVDRDGSCPICDVAAASEVAELIGHAPEQPEVEPELFVIGRRS